MLPAPEDLERLRRHIAATWAPADKAGKKRLLDWLAGEYDTARWLMGRADLPPARHGAAIEAHAAFRQGQADGARLSEEMRHAP